MKPVTLWGLVFLIALDPSKPTNPKLTDTSKPNPSTIQA